MSDLTLRKVEGSDIAPGEVMAAGEPRTHKHYVLDGHLCWTGIGPTSGVCCQLLLAPGLTSPPCFLSLDSYMFGYSPWLVCWPSWVVHMRWTYWTSCLVGALDCV